MSVLRLLIILIAIAFVGYENVYSQSEGSDFCLDNRKVNPIIKVERLIEIYRDDTTTVTYYYEKGLMTKGIILNSCKNCEINMEHFSYQYDSDERRMSSNIEYYDNYKKDNVRFCHKCVYDDENRLKNYVVDRYIGNKLDVFEESIYYLNGTDSIRYKGAVYSNIYVKKLISQKDDNYVELLLDTLGNVQIKKYYHKGLLNTMQYFDLGKETFKKFNLYDGNVLKTEIKEDYDEYKEMWMIYEFTEFKYNEKGKLIEEKEFNGESELLSVKTYTYNQKGFVSNVTENYLFTDEKRVTSHEYEYWDNDK